MSTKTGTFLLRTFSAFALLSLLFGPVVVTAAYANGSYKPAIETNDVANLQPEGSLDTIFDGDGLVTTAFGPDHDEAKAVAIQSDGKIVVAGTSRNLGYHNFAVARYNSDGSLDTAFDVDGKVVTSFGNEDVANAIAIQNDGKIILAGYSTPDNIDASFALTRYNTDGTLDVSFDTDGKLLTNLGSGYDYARDIAIQDDGKIVVVGEKYMGINDYDIALVRYNTDGSLDISFGIDGIVTTAIGSGYEYGASLAIQADGKIIVGGGSSNGNNVDFALLRYNTDGSLDTSFNADGIVTLDFNGGHDRGSNVAIQRDGKIVIAGDDYAAVLLARYNDDGSLDTTFDSDGMVVTSYHNWYHVQDITLQKNGKIVVAGYADVDNDFAAIRYNNNGSLDTSFDADGWVFTDFGGNLDDIANSVAIQTDGKIILAGYRYISGSNYDFALARYIAAGTAIYYAKPVDSGVSDCSTWANACTLQTALTTAVSGDEIWVAAGTHKPTTGSDREATFQLKDNVAIYGGFAGTETARDQRDPASNVTILSGDIGTGSDNGDNSYHVVVGSNTNSSATLDGFTIRDGNANKGDSPDDSPGNIGGGMLNESGSPLLTNIIFSSNSAFYGGGGLANRNYASPILTNVTFSDNTASNYGGGMHNIFSNPLLTNVIFIGNMAVDGGGMFNQVHSNPILMNVTFSENTSDTGGGIVNASDSNSILTNVSFSGNLAVYGGGMCNYESNPTLTNVTFSGNSAKYGGGMSNMTNSSPQSRNTIFWGNTASTDGAQIYNYNDTDFPIVSDSVLQGGCPSGGTCTNIILTDPLLGTLGNYGGFTQTIPILAGSSAIDMGNDAVCPSSDQRGVARPQGAGCDIGAYEFEVAFTKSAPANSATGQSTSPTLSWNTNAGATSYEYCYSSTAGPCTQWHSVGANTSVTLSGLAADYTYFWQMRAVDSGGTTEANDGVWWSFTTTAAPACTWPSYTPPTAPTFGDVPMTVGHWSWVERLANSTITAGCGAGNYCPFSEVVRAQMAIFLLRGKHCGSSYTPPAVGDSTGFGDVPLDATYAPWVKQLAAEGVTAGCGNGNFCPLQVVTRAQMAIFLLRAKHGATYSPPAVGASTGFGDVPLDATYAAWVKQLAAEGVTAGCGSGNFCPLQNVNRAQMATFLVRAFGLP